MEPYALWCQDKVSLDIRDDVLTIAVGSPFLLNCMQKQFSAVLTAAAQAVLGPNASAVLAVDARSSLKSSVSTASSTSRSATRKPPVVSSSAPWLSLPLPATMTKASGLYR